MRCELFREYGFESARRLPAIDQGHPCSRVHGHSFRLRVEIDGVVDSHRGWVMDFGAIDDVVDPVLRELDHRLLNEVAGLENPTSEHIAHWVWDHIVSALPGLTAVTISETASSGVTYRGE